MAEKDILERHVLELADVLVDVLKLTGILLPGFRAEDLHPLPVLELNATLYYGQKPWKGPKTLREFYGAEVCDCYPGLIANDRLRIQIRRFFEG